MSVRLRDLAPADSARLLAWRNRPEVAAHMLTDHRIGQAEHDAWFAAIPSRADRRYWIIELDGAPVGLTNLAAIDRSAERCDWAYYLADPATRGRGVGSCVQYIVLAHVFEAMGFHKVWCEVLAGNDASLRLLEGAGFVREATLRDHVVKAEGRRDVIGLGLLAAEWPAAKARIAARLTRQGHDPAALPAAP
jgi:UDP-4-amino-4,6-dideoxy-N-acetyl-beta-L-altrosamine N-acetyltransferase